MKKEKGPEKAADENVQTWWRAASEKPGEWLQIDLGKNYDVRAVQINFADDKIDIPVPGNKRNTDTAKIYRRAGSCDEMDSGRLCGWRALRSVGR